MSNPTTVQHQQTDTGYNGARDAEGGNAQLPRNRFTGAAESVAAAVLDVGHDVIQLSTGFLQVVPIPGLDEAARLIVKIWDAIDAVKTNQRECLRIAVRSDNMLAWVRSSISDAGLAVADALGKDIAEFVKSLSHIYDIIRDISTKSFVNRYLKRKDIAHDLQGCHQELVDVYDRFIGSMQVFNVKRGLEADRRSERVDRRLDLIERHLDLMERNLYLMERHLNLIDRRLDLLRQHT
ncbi:hypothetical protein C8Q76DRAFT_790690 [Earliella scabrosa]|nr:hypothetical protein C8Q76DRAFT_790690 [Earliella scabrosa]